MEALTFFQNISEEVLILSLIYFLQLKEKKSTNDVSGNFYIL